MYDDDDALTCANCDGPSPDNRTPVADDLGVPEGPVCPPCEDALEAEAAQQAHRRDTFTPWERAALRAEEEGRPAPKNHTPQRREY